MMRILYLIYQWLVAMPILIVVTALTAIFTILFSPFPNTKVAYFPARAWSRIICLLTFVRVEVSGLENIDRKQSYIFVCNHQSIFDVFVVYGWLPVFFKWVMKAELRKIPLVGKACEQIGHIFMNRKNPKAMQRSLQLAEKQLKNGVSVVVFPEGTRTYDGSVGRFKRGAFLLSTDLKLPVIPITLIGAFERLPRNTCNVHPGKIKAIIHAPIDVNPYLPDKQTDLADACRQIVVDTMNAEGAKTK